MLRAAAIPLYQSRCARMNAAGSSSAAARSTLETRAAAECQEISCEVRTGCQVDAIILAYDCTNQRSASPQLRALLPGSSSDEPSIASLPLLRDFFLAAGRLERQHREDPEIRYDRAERVDKDACAISIPRLLQMRRMPHYEPREQRCEGDDEQQSHRLQRQYERQIHTWS